MQRLKTALCSSFRQWVRALLLLGLAISLPAYAKQTRPAEPATESTLNYINNSALVGESVSFQDLAVTLRSDNGKSVSTFLASDVSAYESILSDEHYVGIRCTGQDSNGLPHLCIHRGFVNGNPSDNENSLGFHVRSGSPKVQDVTDAFNRLFALLTQQHEAEVLRSVGQLFNDPQTLTQHGQISFDTQKPQQLTKERASALSEINSALVLRCSYCGSDSLAYDSSSGLLTARFAGAEQSMPVLQVDFDHIAGGTTLAGYFQFQIPCKDGAKCAIGFVGQPATGISFVVKPRQATQVEDGLRRLFATISPKSQVAFVATNGLSEQSTRNSPPAPPLASSASPRSNVTPTASSSASDENDATQNEEEIQGKIDNLNQEIRQLEDDASTADQQANDLATNSNCNGGYGPFAAIAKQGCENINAIGVAKFRSSAAQDRNQVDDDRSEIARLQGEEVQEAPHRDASFADALSQQAQQNPQPNIAETARQQEERMAAVGAANDAAQQQRAQDQALQKVQGNAQQIAEEVADGTLTPQQAMQQIQQQAQQALAKESTSAAASPTSAATSPGGGAPPQGPPLGPAAANSGTTNNGSGVCADMTKWVTATDRVNPDGVVVGFVTNHSNQKLWVMFVFARGGKYAKDQAGAVYAMPGQTVGGEGGGIWATGSGPGAVDTHPPGFWFYAVLASDEDQGEHCQSPW
jgi:hypothetical protein